MVVLSISFTIHCSFGCIMFSEMFSLRNVVAHSHCWLGLSTSTASNVQHRWRNVTWSWHATVSLSRSLQSCVLVPIPVRWASLFKQWGARPSFKSLWDPTEPVDSSTLPTACLWLEVRSNTLLMSAKMSYVNEKTSDEFCWNCGMCKSAKRLDQRDRWNLGMLRHSRNNVDTLLEP